MRYLLLVVIYGLCASAALAHELKTAISTVSYNERSGNIEIMHRFYVHDAEHAVKQLFNKSADLINDTQTQQTFSQYVSERFALRSVTGENLPLTLVGGQLEGRFFWVYQELPAQGLPSPLQVKHNSLQHLWPAQVNHVNIERSGQVQTLTFTYDSGWLQSD